MGKLTVEEFLSDHYEPELIVECINELRSLQAERAENVARIARLEAENAVLAGKLELVSSAGIDGVLDRILERQNTTLKQQEEILAKLASLGLVGGSQD